MSAADWAAATLGVSVAILVGGLLVVLLLLVATLRNLRRSIDDLRSESVAALDEMRELTHEAAGEVDRVGAVLDAADIVGQRLDGASKLAARTVSSPVVKALALGTGTRRAVRRMRRPGASDRSSRSDR
ncbi:MAG TPA: hypothetical protein VFF40_12660 [Acidimicrobiia bacterium]|nr:hypothetical protein [Acidimicrobiia bacterium]